jgi:hypothetical protein
MNSIAKHSAVWVLVLVCLLPVTALGANPDRTGTAGAQELLIPVGARGVGLGLSGSLFITGVDAIYWNPAGVCRMTNSVQAMFSQMSYIADVSVSYGAIAVGAGDFGTLGFSLKSLAFGDIPVTTVDFPDGTGDVYSPTYLTLGATYSKALTDRIAVGITADLVSEKILQMSATGLTFDIGIQYRDLAVKGLQLAVAIKHIGPNMSFDGSNAYVQATAVGSISGIEPYKIETAPFEMPSSLEIGIGYSPKLDEVNSVTVGGTFVSNNYLQDEYSLGAEYSLKNTFYVRGGYTFSPQTAKDAAGARAYIYDWSAGAGVRYNVGGVDLAFDYGYRDVKYFTGNNVFTLMVGF